MKTTSHRARTLACALLATTATCGLTAAPAQAQATAEMPALYPAVDQNGVDVVSGKLSLVLASVNIGPGGPGSLFYNWATDAGAKAITEGHVRGNGSEYIVSIGGSSEKFTLSGALGSGTFTHAQGRPSTLTYDSLAQRFTYTGADGSVTLYQRYGDLSSTSSATARLLSLTYPSGEKLNFVYASDGSVRSIWTNLGYQMRFVNPGDGTQQVVLFNMAQESCAPEAASCSLAGSWPRLTLENGKATDSLGRVTTKLYPVSGQFEITYPTGRKVTYGYTSVGETQRIDWVNDGAGTWTYTYGGDQFVGVNTITAPNGSTRTIFWQKMTGQVTQDTLMLQSQESRTTNYAMDSAGRITTVSNPDGTKVQYAYDGRGNPKEKRIVSNTPGTPADIVTSASYPDACANPKTCNKPNYAIDARGARTDFAYDANHGGVTRVTSPAGPNGVRPEVRNSYTSLSATYKNGSGTLVQGAPVYKLTASLQCVTGSSCVGTADEVKTTISYSAGNALLPGSTTSGSGNGSLSATTAFTYTANGDVKTLDEPLPGTADTVRNYYDAARQLTGAIGPDPDGDGPLRRRALRFSYNEDGQVKTREAGTATDNGDGGMGTFQPLEQEVTSFNAQGRKEKESFVSGGATSAVTQYSYTPSGQLDCAAQRMDPGAFGNLPSACAQSGNGTDRIVQNSYNAFFELTKVRTGIGTGEAQDEVITTYDKMGRPLSATDGENNRTSYEYDGFGRLSKTVYPVAAKNAGTSNSGDYEQLGYDAGSNVTSTRLRDGSNIYFSYDALNRMSFKDLPCCATTDADVTYAYDNLGRLTQARDANGSDVRMSYDALGRQLSESNHYYTSSSQYDLAGRRTRLTWKDGFYVGYDYLTTGELTHIRENGAYATPSLAAIGAYPPSISGRTATSPSNQPWDIQGGVVGPALTGSARVAVDRTPGHWTILGFSFNSGTYTNQGTNQHYMIYVDPNGTIYWEEDGPPADATYNTSAKRMTMIYDGSKLRVLGDGTEIFSVNAAAGQTLYPKILFNGPNIKATDIQMDDGKSVLATIAYDDLGRRTSLLRGNGTVTRYGFDPVSRLASLAQDLPGTANDLNLTFGYNPASQIRTNTRSNDAYAWTGHGSGTTNSTANGLNQLAAHGGATFSYDAKGNLTSKGSGTNYGYDAKNRLWSVNGGFAFYYDPLGRLEDSAGAGLLHAYDGVDLIAEYADRGATVARRYVHGPGVDEPLVWYEGSGTGDKRYLHADERGSVVAVSDGAGNAIGVNRYDEYGKPASTNIGRFQYTGQTWRPEVGLYNYKARFYDPIGRFMQPDPIGYDDGMNMYVYVKGDPVNKKDAFGLDGKSDPVPPLAPEGEEIVVIGQVCRGVWFGDTCVLGIFFELGDFRYDSFFNWYTPVLELAIVGLVDMGREVYCSATAKLGANGRVRLGADAMGFGGLGGASGTGVSINSNGSLSFDAYAGWGGGFGGVAGAGLSIGNDAPPAGISHSSEVAISGGLKVVGGTVTRSQGGTTVTGGLSIGPKIGYAGGTLSKTTYSAYTRSPCR